MHEPPKEIPAELFNEFTLQNTIPVEYVYRNHTGDGTPLVFNDAIIEKHMTKAKQRVSNYYGCTDLWLHKALEQHQIYGMDVVVMGSTSPFYECVCMEHGANIPINTIEYRKIICDDERFNCITPDEFRKSPKTFDVALSISSFEHDGLGRYGDPIDPNGDLKAMAEMKTIVKPGGLLFLAIPIENNDKLIWNLHRVYGPKRLELLLKGWTVINAYGFGDEYTGDQPLLVLLNE
jgi:SAM-dependent methyltransferase